MKNLDFEIFNFGQIKQRDLESVDDFVIRLRASAVKCEFADKDAEIKKLKSDLDEANTKLLRIDALDNQVKELEASLAKKTVVKIEPKKETKVLPKKEVRKTAPTKKTIKKQK